METLTLKEFLETVKAGLESSFPLHYWVTAEISGLRINPNSKHCYLDLVEKNEHAVVAKSGGVIWEGRFEYINKKFAESTGQELKDGLKVLLLINILFHELYGFKLNIDDIDPSYTLGEFALHRKKILERLEKEGLLGKNRMLSFPEVPQRIAIISSPSAAGYEDFINTLSLNKYGYTFSTRLFPAFMQGEQTEKSVVDAISECVDRRKEFDVVIIIRGGGDQVDLHGFDNYAIGKAISLCPLPVITGIGHRRDESVADFAAHTRMISPTAVAEFIISRTRDFEDRLDKAGTRLESRMKQELSAQNSLVETAGKHLSIFTGFFLRNQGKRFSETGVNFRNGVSKRIAYNEFRLQQVPLNLMRNSLSLMKNRLSDLDRHREKIELMNPARLLEKGYSLTYKNGSILKNTDGISPGDSIETRLHRGKTVSTVTEVKERGEP